MRVQRVVVATDFLSFISDRTYQRKLQLFRVYAGSEVNTKSCFGFSYIKRLWYVRLFRFAVLSIHNITTWI